MCRTDTVSSRAHQLALLLVATGTFVSLSFAQVSQGQISWSHVGGTAVASGLAGRAGGAVRGVWYSADGARLFVRTATGRIFETADLERWQLNRDEVLPLNPGASQVSGGRIYSLRGGNLFSSSTGGKVWINLTGFNGQSVVGGGANVLAENPRNSQELTIGNASGLWRSADGGLTWQGLNDGLPNLPLARLLTPRTALLQDGSAITVEAGTWVPTEVSPVEGELRLKAAQKLGTAVSVVAMSVTAQQDSVAYAGTPDGRLFASHDGGATWLESPRAASGLVSRIWLDNDRADVALAIAGNRLFRTINGGGFWDDVTGSMPEMQLRSVTADRSASVLYAATDRGVFTAKLSLNDAGASAGNWASVSQDLPSGPAVDVHYNVDGTLTAALEGYGVFEAAAPHRTRAVRLLNGADLTVRPAAPGSLVSVVGAELLTARSGEMLYPVLGASSSGTQLQVPFESGVGIVTLALESGSDRWTLPLTVKESAPALFVDSDGSPLVLDADSGLVIDPRTALHAGARVQLLATGLGKVNPDWPTGVPAPLDSPPAVRGSVSAFLDGVPVEVTRATLAPGYVGYYTVELQLPKFVNRGASELVLTMNAEQSNKVKLYLEPSPAGN